MKRVRRAKIICTMGPASSSEKMISRLVREGMDVARLNFSHGTYEEHRETVRLIRRASARYGTPVAILQDLKGLKVRVGRLRHGAAVLKDNSTVTITAANRKGDGTLIPVSSYPYIARAVKKGDTVLLNDGQIQLRVTGRKRGGLTARVLEGGLLLEKQGVNLPGTSIPGAVFTEKDRRDLEFGLKEGVDFIAISFVRSHHDVLAVKNWLRRHHADVPVIAKIEKPGAVEDADRIIEISDGIMIARGDLGVEVSFEKVPIIQKTLIEKCNRALKPVITATQMLESMTGHMRPTRAEAADIANAVLDGTDALMLSGETAVGKYPVRALSVMDRIISYTEGKRPVEVKRDVASSGDFAHAIAEAACISAEDILARAIVCFSRSGFTSLLVSKFRPRVPVICFTAHEGIRRKMNLYWGVTPLVMKFPESIDEMISLSERALLRSRRIKKGDPIVIIAASPFSTGGKTNIMKIHSAGI